MKKLQWWFRVIGVWYLLLFMMNIYMMFLGSQQYLIDSLPFPTDQWAVRAFVDGWSPFLFEMLGIATFALWASRKPGKHTSAALLLVWLEFMHGVLDDLFLIVRGYEASGYIAFIVIHLIIIASGLWAVRQAEGQVETVVTPARV
ncbi:MAG TPA: BphX family protein [Chloroflexota bacterium]|nr:BphX family protein [Chloroflexota bacterium]HUM71929.1 BphX family protein [Chloroflexota bacterium]